MKIYILVEVTYDYYRFQKNLAVSTDKDLLRKSAEIISKKRVFDYPTIDDTPMFLDSQEEDHLWIQEFINLTL